MTHRAQATAAADVNSISRISGKAPDPGPRIIPASTDSAAPPPIIKAPPRPAADPASAGRTDSMPALALGSSTPLPKPMKIMNPKNASGDCTPDKSRISNNIIPIVLSDAPSSTIRLTPTRTE